MKILIFKIFSFIFLLHCLSSCNAVKRVPDDAYLLNKNTVYVNGVETSDAKIDNFILQKANSRLLGLPLGLYIYNLAKENPEADFDKWLESNPKTHRNLDRFLSQKQVTRLKESFFVSGIHKQLKKLGEAPEILSLPKTHSSENYLKAYYNSIGYFNSKINDSINYEPNERKKRVDVSYHIETGKQYCLDSLRTSIASPEIETLYNKHLSQSFLKSGNPYALSDFNSERNRLTTLFRNNGFYTFQQSSINFEIVRDTIASNDNQEMDVTTIIDDLVERDGDIVTKKTYRVHRYNKIRIFADYDYKLDKKSLDSIDYKDVTIYYKNKLKYRPRILEMASAFNKGAVYSDESRGLTYKQINNLRIFKYPNIEFNYAKNDTLQRLLDTDIYLVPMEKFSIRLSNEVKVSEIEKIGISLGTSFLTRNALRLSEVIELNLQGTFAAQYENTTSDKFFNMSEISGDIRLVFPEIIFPFNTTRLIPYSTTPQTIFQVGTSVQTNVGLDKRNITGGLRYVWNPGKNRSVLDLINIQYVNNLNPDNFFNVYQNTYGQLNDIAKNYTLDSSYVDANGDLTTTEGGALRFMASSIFGLLPDVTESDRLSILAISERYSRLTNNDYILSSSFTYIFNNNFQFNQRDFSQFRVKIQSAGSLLNLLSVLYETEKSENNKNKFFGVEYAQFIKTEFDYIKHFPVGRESSIAMRSFLGVAIPYGNSTNVPFTQSYFAGGYNDNRGWKAYSLGPGSSNSILDYNEANMKLALSVEYRFPISGAFKGALFTDAGNIWNVFDDVYFSSAKFKGFESLKDIGVSSGIGFRYDFGFFVFRLDLGNKIYNPAKSMESRWFSDISLKNIVFNIGINYPF